MNTPVRIFTTVILNDSKKRILVGVSSKKFKTVSDVQYHVLSQLEIDVGNSIVETLVNKHVVSPSERSTIFRDGDIVHILIVQQVKHTENAKSKKAKVESPVVVQQPSMQPSARKKEKSTSKVSHKPQELLATVKPKEKLTASLAGDTVDVSSIWRKMKATTSVPLNVPNKKRKLPQNNEELIHNYENRQLGNEVPRQVAKVSYLLTTEPLPAVTSSSSVKETKPNYNQLPLVRNIAQLMVGDEVVFKYVCLCEKTFTPTVSQFLRALVLSVGDTTVSVTINKVDRFEKLYFVGQTVEFRWTDWGEVRMLKKFAPPLPPGPPPVMTAVARSSDTGDTQKHVNAVGNGEDMQEEEEVGESLFSLFSEDIQRKKSELSG